ILEDNKRNVKKYSTEKDLGFVQLIEDKIRCEFLDLNRNAEETKLFEYFCEKLKQCPGFRIKVKLDFLFNELIEGITRSRDTNFIHRKYKDVIDEVYDLRYITPYKVYLAYKLAQTKIKVLQSEGVFDGSKVNKKI
ncbi:MAG: hypothetical protein Q4F34_02945, partial [Prevotellaceae bacterium]|nr:hypothetical protein [Prevotellaceae bacterium]